MPKSRAEFTARERLFCHEYGIDLCAKAAAIRAGYSEKTAGSIGSELLQKPHIAAEVERLQGKKLDKLEITAERVLRELALLGFSNMLDYMQVTPEGDAYIDLSEVTRDQAAALAEVTVEEYKEGRGEQGRDVKRTKVKVADKRGALELLGKHLGVFKDSAVNLNVTGDQVQVYLPDNGRG